ncbi:MAG: helix-turn-helix domain-containing protein, partial [Dechloromonas sp.]|nr:helix-turn-helix domain-containing protein [Dechloromonas sp.]
MSKRHPNPRLAKIHRNYTVEEIATLFGVHRNTVRAWVKRGLPTSDDRRPMLILGRDLVAFLQAQRAKNKRTCLPGEIYCVRCRTPKTPAGEMADYEALTTTQGNLIAICPDCETIVYRRVSLAKLAQIRGKLDITFPQALRHKFGGAPQLDLSQFDENRKKQNKGIIADIGTGLKRGVEQMPGMVTGLADIVASPLSAIAGINRPFSRGAEYLGEKTGFEPGKWAEQAQSEYSPEMQRSIENVQKAEGFFPTLGAVAENPRVAANLVAESLPSTIAGGLLARGAMGAVTGAEKLAALRTAAGGADMAAANAAKTELLKRGAIAAGIGEGAVTAGQQMAQTGYDVDPLRAAGSALAAGAITGAIGAGSGRIASSALGKRLGLADLETSMAAGTLGQVGARGPKAYAQRIGSGIVQEGLLEEAPQSANEQAWQNIANSKPWDEGIGSAAAQGLVAGGIMGGAVNSIPGRRYAESKLNQQTRPQDEQPIIPPGVTITTEPDALKQRVDMMLDLDTNKMPEQAREQYKQDLAKVFDEPVGTRIDANQNEVPFTMGEYLDAQVKAQSANQQATNRLAQLADEEAQQHAAITRDLVRSAAQGGALSKAALTGIQSGATQMPVHPERAAIEQQMLMDEAAQAEITPIERLMRSRSDAQVRRVAENENAATKMRQAAIADLQRRMETKAQPTTTSPLQQTATRLNVPALGAAQGP